MRLLAAVFMLVTGVGCSARATIYTIDPADSRRSQGVPAGHLPPPGSCRVWYDDRPAGQQPPPTSCREAERVAARERGARVIYSEQQ